MNRKYAMLGGGIKYVRFFVFRTFLKQAKKVIAESSSSARWVSDFGKVQRQLQFGDPALSCHCLVGNFELSLFLLRRVVDLAAQFVEVL